MEYGSNELTKDIQDETSVGVERLRDMLLQLAEDHPHEIQEQDQCKDLIRHYFTETKSLPVHKLV